MLDFAATAAVPAGGALSVSAGRALVGPASLFCDASSNPTWATAAWQLGGSGGPAVPWIDGSDAVISGSDTTITLSSAVSADSITFTGGGCTIQGAAAGDTLTTSAVDVETGTTTISAVVAGGNGLFVTGPGTLVLTATSAYTGGTTIDQGSTLQIGSGGTAGSINADAGDGIVDNGSLIFDRSDNPAPYTGAISGSGNVVVAGGGTVTLSGGNTFTGGTVIASGTLALDGSPALSSSGQISVGRSGTVDLTGLLTLPSQNTQDSDDTGGGSGLSIQQTGGGGDTEDTPVAGPTELLYDLQATSVTDSNGNDLNYDADDNYTGAYTISPDGKTVTVNSADAIPADGATVNMNIYADVLDANNDLAAWEAAYNTSTYLTTTYRNKTWDYYGPASYDPTYQTCASPTAQGSVTDYQQRGVGNLFPYLDVGLAWAALQFYNSAEGADALPGDLSAAANNTDFHQYSGDGQQVANANGGMDVGVGGPAPIEDEFYVINNMITTVNPNSAAFPYVTATSQNPNGLVSYVTIDGSLYDQLYLGTLSFAVSSASAGQTATINAAGVPECDGGPTTYWMCDGQPLVSAGLGGIGTIGSTDPVSVSVAGQYESQDSSSDIGNLPAQPSARVPPRRARVPLLACPAVTCRVPRARKPQRPPLPRPALAPQRPPRPKPRPPPPWLRSATSWASATAPPRPRQPPRTTRPTPPPLRPATPPPTPTIPAAAMPAGTLAR